MISDLILDKPSKANSVVFILFGYVLSSYLISPIQLIFEQKVPAIIVAGGIFSAFLFYLKPVDFVIKTFLVIRNWIRLKTKIKSILHTIQADKLLSYMVRWDVINPKLLNSSLLSEEMAKINGAVFFAISLFLGSRLLELVNLYVPFQLLVLLGVIMLIVAFWDILYLVNYKLPIIAFHYRLYRIGETSVELSAAVNNKEWILANQIMNNILEYKTPLTQKMSSLMFVDFLGLSGDYKSINKNPYQMSSGGICLNCNFVVRKKDSYYCPKCGSKLTIKCSNCEETVIADDMQEIPSYCSYCGTSLGKTSAKKN